MFIPVEDIVFAHGILVGILTIEGTWIIINPVVFC